MSKKQMPAAVGGWTAWCYGIRELSRESRIATRKAQTEKPASQEASHAG
jgi:hypothetical protein